MNKTYATKNTRRNVKQWIVGKQKGERNLILERRGWHPINEKTC